MRYVQETEREIEWLEDKEQQEDMGSGRYVWDKIWKHLTGPIKD